MISKFIWPMVIVGLPNVNDIKTSISKLDYTIPYAECQQPKQQNTLDYNYIKTEDLLELNNSKYQKIL